MHPWVRIEACVKKRGFAYWQRWFCFGFDSDSYHWMNFSLCLSWLWSALVQEVLLEWLCSSSEVLATWFRIRLWALRYLLSCWQLATKVSSLGRSRRSFCRAPVPQMLSPPSQCLRFPVCELGWPCLGWRSLKVLLFWSSCRQVRLCWGFERPIVVASFSCEVSGPLFVGTGATPNPSTSDFQLAVQYTFHSSFSTL